MSKKDGDDKVGMMPGVIRRTLGWGERLMQIHFCVDAGSVFPPHSHENEQMGYVLKGKFEMTIGEKTSIMRTGDCFIIPSGVSHHARTIESTEIIDTFSPPREDYK